MTQETNHSLVLLKPFMYIILFDFALSLQKKNFGPKEAEFGYPAEVLNFLRHIAPGNIKDEIRD